MAAEWRWSANSVEAISGGEPAWTEGNGGAEMEAEGDAAAALGLERTLRLTGDMEDS